MLPASTISTDLSAHVRQIYKLAVTEIRARTRIPSTRNEPSRYAVPAYVISVAAIEAFVNETTLGPLTASMPQRSKLRDLEKLRGTKLIEKLCLLPRLLVDEPLDSGKQPLQDAGALIRVRNDFVHFKMIEKERKYMCGLEKRGIVLKGVQPAQRSVGGDPGLILTFVEKLSSTEGIRWAHNTACKTAWELARVLRPMDGFKHIANLASGFHEISDAVADEAMCGEAGPAAIRTDFPGGLRVNRPLPAPD